MKLSVICVLFVGYILALVGSGKPGEKHIHLKIVVPVPVHNHKHTVTIYKKPPEQKRLIVHKHVHSHGHGHKHAHLHGHNHNHPQGHNHPVSTHGYHHYDYGHKNYDWGKYSGAEYHSNNGFKPSQPLSTNSYGSAVNYDHFKTNIMAGYNPDDDYNNFVKKVQTKNYYSARESGNDRPAEGYYSTDNYNIHESDPYDVTESYQSQYSSPEDGNEVAENGNGNDVEYHEYERENDFDEYEYAGSTNYYQKRRPSYKNVYGARGVKPYWTVSANL